MPPDTVASQQDPQAPGFELDQVDVYGKYMLSTPVEVLFILRSMLKRGTMATVYFDHARSFFLTCILGITSDEKYLILDISSDEEVNRLAIGADRLTVTTNLDSVKVQFVLRGLSETTFEGRPAFLAAVPESLLRLQRREYFRLETPIAEPLYCQIQARNESGSTHAFNLTLMDISGGGLSLMVPSDAVDYFKIGTMHPECRLMIPETGALLVTLCVRSAFNVTAKNGQSYVRAGCEFINLPGTRLNAIQRYITRIERERKAKSAALL